MNQGVVPHRQGANAAVAHRGGPPPDQRQHQGTEEVRLLRRRVAAPAKEGRMSPRGANLAVAAGSPLSTTLLRLLATDGTTTSSLRN